MNELNKSNICYTWDESLIQECDRLPAVVGRASLVHNLITAYGLLKHVKVVRSTVASYNELKEFHSELYLDHLKKLTEVDDDYIPDSEDVEYGIGYDCPPVSNMYKLVSTIAGGSITAAKCLILGIADVSINWCGGWHHGQRFGAEGFCYVNDIVLAIEKLRPKFPKVLYVDLDVHHGNGVQDAYNLSKSVFTLSFHKYEPGFYPGTGSLQDIGSSSGIGYTCNFPLNAGYNDDSLMYAFEKVFPMICARFVPDAIVVQCGADALARDPHGGAALTTQGYFKCLQIVLENKIPILLLGGGGYKYTNAARLWTSLLALLLGVTLDDDIPEHDMWPKYGPDFSLLIENTLNKDNNSKEYLDNCITTIESNVINYLESCSGSPLVKRKKIENEIKHTINQNSIDMDSTIRSNIKTSTDMEYSSSAIYNKISPTKSTFHLKTILKNSYLKEKRTPALKEQKDVYEFTD